VIIYWPRSSFDEARADIEGILLTALELAPNLAERVRAAEQSERYYGTGDVPFFFRKPFGPGWALVGDAGYHKDPIIAQGITDAFRDARLLADAIDSGFSGASPLDEALVEYERARNEAAAPIYAMTQDFGTLAPPPVEMQQLFAALRDDQEQTDRFFGTVAGTVPIAEFFSPVNLARITDAAAPA
jgi:2-polyprenyl-6-methoxyphenol hydroxylase-like FAD-dependent oxidoreductase